MHPISVLTNNGQKPHFKNPIYNYNTKYNVSRNRLDEKSKTQTKKPKHN